jgi:alanine racemase
MDARSSAGEPRVFINREALIHNARIIRQAIGPKVSVCAVVKADAYGHDATIVADTLCTFPLDEMGSPPINALAVATLDEAVKLPEPNVPVLILRPVENAYVGRQRTQIEQAIRNGWIMTICSPAAADDIHRIAMNMQAMAYVQVMVDTGMSRSGVQPEHFRELMGRINRHVSLRLFGFCTHFASSEEETHCFTLEQFTRFCEVTNEPTALRKQRGVNIVRHAANSGAVFGWPQTHLDMVRPGLALYGIDPSGTFQPGIPLMPAMKWTASILLLRDIETGTGVGYNQTWHAPRDSRLALVPVGYADGYLRVWSNNAVMMVHGKPAPVVGRVSMDMTMIDVTDIPEAHPGDEVVIMDDDPESPASVYALAKQGGTIPYEVFCRIGSRVHRVAAGEPTIADPMDPRVQEASIRAART